MNAPIIILTYSRPEHFNRVLLSLEQNEDFRNSTLYIFCDGEKQDESEHVKKNIAKVRDIAKSKQWTNDVRLNFAVNNRGLKKSVINAVSEVLKHHGRAIVLEDDIEVAPHFLKYMNEALEKYKDNEKVMHISAYQVTIDSADMPDSFFMRFMSCWGWATWERAWKKFDDDIDEIFKKFDDEMINRINLDGAYNFWKQMIDNKEGKLNTWAIFWYSSIFMNNGLCLFPAKSLVKNIGLDGSGLHTGKTSAFDTDLSLYPIANYPDVIQENTLAYERFRNFYLNLSPPEYRNIFGKTRDFFENILGIKK